VITINASRIYYYLSIFINNQISPSGTPTFYNFDVHRGDEELQRELERESQEGVRDRKRERSEPRIRHVAM